MKLEWRRLLSLPFWKGVVMTVLAPLKRDLPHCILTSADALSDMSVALAGPTRARTAYD